MYDLSPCRSAHTPDHARCRHQLPQLPTPVWQAHRASQAGPEREQPCRWVFGCELGCKARQANDANLISPQCLASSKVLQRHSVASNKSPPLVHPSPCILFSGISINDVAAVLTSARELQELAIGSTGLTGTLSCDIQLPNLQVCVCVCVQGRQQPISSRNPTQHRHGDFGPAGLNGGCWTAGSAAGHEERGALHLLAGS